MLLALGTALIPGVLAVAPVSAAPRSPTPLRARTMAGAPSVPELGPFPSVDRFVEQQYVDAGGRAPTSAELDEARTELNEHGESAGDFMASVAAGPGRAAQAAQVARLYLGELGRRPGFDRFDHWRGQLAAGTPLTTLGRTFGTSAEFDARFPSSLSNTAFVTRLYTTILGRIPDAPGLAGWLASLTKGTARWRVALGFTESPEYRTDRETTASALLAFAVMVRRIPSAAELDLATTLVEGGGYASLSTKLLTTSVGYAHRFPAPAEATSLYEDASHDGFGSTTLISPTATARWTHHFDNTVGYPLVARGRVFVAVAGPGPGTDYGARLYALSAATGELLWGPIAVAGTYQFAALTYENGRVFSLDFDGVLAAFDARTGTLDWVKHLGSEYFVDAAPTASGGLVYSVGSYKLHAVDEATGNEVWSVGDGGIDSAPVVTPGAVYLSYDCGVHAYDPTTGSVLWTHLSNCVGNSGTSAVLHAGRLYVRNFDAAGDIVLDAATGAPVDSFASANAPAFDGGRAFFVTHQTLRANDLATGRALWSQTGDGHLLSGPVVGNGIVYMGSTTGAVFGYDEGTGVQVWSGTAGSTSIGSGDLTSPLPSGMALGGDQLLVPAGDDLTAFG